MIYLRSRLSFCVYNKPKIIFYDLLTIGNCDMVLLEQTIFFSFSFLSDSLFVVRFNFSLFAPYFENKFSLNLGHCGLSCSRTFTGWNYWPEFQFELKTVTITDEKHSTLPKQTGNFFWENIFPNFPKLFLILSEIGKIWENYILKISPYRDSRIKYGWHLM